MNATRGFTRFEHPVRLLRRAGLALGVSFLILPMVGATTVGAAPTRWTVTPSPTRGGGADQLNGVSCAGRTFCVAVGWYRGSAGTLVETWNGTRWSLTPSPSPTLTTDDELDAVSCTSPTFCAAVGWHTVPSTGREKTLIETWNGKKWSVSASSSLGVQSLLLGVSCTRPSSCEAIGWDDKGPRGGALAESWNGRAWAVVPTPTGTLIGPEFLGVSCATSASCSAVGSYEGVYGLQTLAASWNGSRWAVVPSPNRTVDGNDELDGVSCPSSKSCAAVGLYTVGDGPERTLAESWNGRKWSIVSSPNAISGPNWLTGISCTGSSNCVAAGFDLTNSSAYQSLIESWNGSRWVLTPSPDSSADQQLLAVECSAASSCDAVGYHGSGSLLSDKTLVETGS